MTEFKNVEFEADLDEVLKLVSRSLYTNQEIFLRELISNASDACNKLRYESLSDQDLMEDDPELMIRISFDKEEKVLIVYDNGIGMNEKDLVENLGTVARSGTKKFMENIRKAGENGKGDLIGCFGVGFYSVFMVAEEVEVHTRKAGEEKGWIWKSSGTKMFSIGEYECKDGEEKMPRGTKIIMKMKPEGEVYLNKYKVSNIVDNYSKHISFPIELTDEEGKSEILNEKPAIWVRNKNEVSQEEYKKFFKSLVHVEGEPWMILHNKNEGVIDYINLLFIPKFRPVDLFHPDRRTAVQLYSSRVFITADNSILTPAYLRFVYGLVDSPDLPLNISRESLQNNHVSAAIKKSLTSRILSELKKRSEEDKESYTEFWLNFGDVLKEGLCEAMPTDQRESLMSVCRFYSSKYENDELISIEDYIERMKPEQKVIYYLCGKDKDSIRKSPQLEGFIKRDIEVLLLSDHADDFWTTVVTEYKSKDLKSITRSDIDLGAFPVKQDETDGDHSEDSNKDNEGAGSDKLVDYFSRVLGDNVSSVKLSKKLVSSPACLVVLEGSMDIGMERFLREQRQLNYKNPKILEINPKHNIIKKMGDILTENPDDTRLREIVFMLFDEACIFEGEEVVDVDAFAGRINSFLDKFVLQD